MAKDFIKNLTKKHIIIFTSLWFVGFFLQLLAATDLFTKSLLDTKYFMSYVMVIGPTLFMLLLTINYQKNKSIKND